MGWVARNSALLGPSNSSGLSRTQNSIAFMLTLAYIECGDLLTFGHKTMALIGYARVSTKDQDLALQLAALREAGCEEDHIFMEKESGAKKKRPALDDMLRHIRKGDTVIVYKLDRLARSVSHLLELAELFKDKSVGLKTLTGVQVDTTTSSGKLIFAIFSAIAEFERDLIHERTKAGIDRARAAGQIFGRPRIDQEKVDEIRRRFLAGESWRAINKATGVATTTIGRYLDELAETDPEVKAKRQAKPANGRRKQVVA